MLLLLASALASSDEVLGSNADPWETFHMDSSELAVEKKDANMGLVVHSYYRPPGCGQGQLTKNGDKLRMKYTGWLYVNGARQGQPFDSTSKPGRDPFGFTIGQHMVIGGWDAGLLGMCQAEKRKLIIPPSLGYGDNGFPPLIPGGSTLFFDVELVSFSSGSLRKPCYDPSCM